MFAWRFFTNTLFHLIAWSRLLVLVAAAAGAGSAHAAAAAAATTAAAAMTSSKTVTAAVCTADVSASRALRCVMTVYETSRCQREPQRSRVTMASLRPPHQGGDVWEWARNRPPGTHPHHFSQRRPVIYTASLQPGRLVPRVVHDFAGVKKLDKLLVQGTHLQARKPPILINGGRQRPALYFPQRADQAACPVLALQNQRQPQAGQTTSQSQGEGACIG